MATFEGFPKAGLRFLDDLAANNSREWFNEHKAIFQDQLQKPALAFVEALGGKMATISPEIHFDLKTNGSGSLMRIARDTRFSKDKTPYKTAIAGMLWQGPDKKTASPGFGFHLESNGMYLMAGMFQFSKEQLEAYREAVDHPRHGAKLAQAVADVQAAGFPIKGEHYKRVPRPYGDNHDRAELLKYNGLYASYEKIPPQRVVSPQIVDECFDKFAQLAPIQQWLAVVML